MSSRYWIKLYHEILDDPNPHGKLRASLGRLTDTLFRRVIELFTAQSDKSWTLFHIVRLRISFN